MRYRYIYKYKTGLTKVKTRLAIALSILGLGAGGVVGSLAIFGAAHAATPNWQLTAPTAIIFGCGGGDYNHTLQSVTEDSTTGNFSGNGSYDADSSYTWRINGNVSGDNITFTLVYTGSNSGYTLNGTGTIANNGSVNGTVVNSCQTFSMPAGSATAMPLTPTCTPVNTSTKGSLTAALVNPPGTYSDTLNAAGCDIGVYYDNNAGNIDTANISGAKMYGVFVDRGADVSISDSTIHHIGDNPFTGNQYGIGIYYTSGSSGTVSGNTVYDYQKNGMAFTLQSTDVNATGNTVTGNGAVPYIAQNGIQFGYGASGSASGNIIDGNWYTGDTWTSTGLLLFDVSANNVKKSNNTYMNNQTNLAVVTAQSCPHQYGGFYAQYKLCTYTP